MPITNWPLEDRPSEKLKSQGAQALTEAELIAIFLKTGTRGKTALDLAKELLHDYGGLKKLMGIPLTQLCKKAGMGQAKSITLKAALELGRRSLQAQVAVGEVLDNSRLMQNYLADRLRHHSNEVFACVFMDNHLRLISFEELFHGTVNEAAIYPREIIRRGLLHNAAKLILAHNHPSGNATPSAADKEVTQLIQQTLAMVDIEVVDHIIVGHNKHFSFREAGLL